MSNGQPIRIVTALIDDGHGRALLVHKRGTAAFMQPAVNLNLMKTRRRHWRENSTRS